MEVLRSPGGRWPLRATVLLVLCAGLLAAGRAGAAGMAVAPANTAVPVVTGTAQVGSTLSAPSGTWTGDLPITFTYQWQRCDSAGANCVAIPSATASTFALTAADAGHELRVAVTGTNGAGNATATSAATSVVTVAAAGAPVAVFPPFVSGMPFVGLALSGSTGSWTGTLPLSFAFEWQRCDQYGQGCQAIAGATGQGYTLVSDDVGHRVRLHVTATNSVGSTDAFSRTTGVVQAAPTGPTDKKLCKRGGWRSFGLGFRNQGQCVKSFEHDGRLFGGRGGDDDRGKGGGSGKIGINQGVQIGGAAGAANAGVGGSGSNGRGHGDNGGGHGRGD